MEDRVQESNLRLAGGILLILWGVAMFIFGMLLTLYGGWMLLFGASLFLIVGITGTVIAVLAVLGGVFACTGKNYGLLMVGAICALIPAVLLVWPLLVAIPALVFVVIRRETFSVKAAIL